MRLKTLLEDIPELKPFSDCDVIGLSQDSRQLQKGDLFFAYPGEQTDGRAFISDAIQKGAAAILVEENPGSPIPKTSIPVIAIKDLSFQISAIAAKFYHYPGLALNIIGVTGTNGKTSCTHFIAACLQASGRACGLIGGLGNGAWIPDTAPHLSPSLLTTPDAIELQRLLADFRDQGIKIIIIETSSHRLAQGRLTGIPFTMAAFTNLSQEHLDYHNTMTHYANAKRRLFESPSLQQAILNADDPQGLQWLHELPAQVSTFAYSLNPPIPQLSAIPYCYAQEVNQGPTQGLTASLYTPWGKGRLHAPHLIGHFNLSNLLLVVVVLCLLKLPLSVVLKHLKSLRSVTGRMEILGGGIHPQIVVDYAHTPDALQQVLQTLKQQTRGKLYCVFGCGGNRDSKKRPMMGAIAEYYADSVILTEDNPRQESVAQITDEIRSGFHNPSKAIVEHNRQKAIRYAIGLSQTGDTVLIAGKGHQTYRLTEEGNSKLLTDTAIVTEILAHQAIARK